MTPAPLTGHVRRAGRLVALFSLCVYLATAGGSLTSTDAVMTYEVTKSLVLHGSVAASYNVIDMEAHRGSDGRYYSPFGIGQSVFNVPFYVGGHALREWGGLRIGRADSLEKAAVALGNTVAAAGLVWVAFLFAWRLCGQLHGSIWTALAVGFGTLIWPYSKFGFNAPLAAWCLLGGVYAAWVGVRTGRPALIGWSGVWLGCAFLTRHEMALMAAVVAAWTLFESRDDWRRTRERVLWLGAPLATAGTFWLLYNVVRFGHPLYTGYAGDPGYEIHGPLDGIHGLLFSPGRSLFLYVPLAAAAPLAMASLTRRDRSTAALLTGLVVVYFLFIASLPAWDARRAYGPRYLVPVLPLLVLPLAWWFRPGSGRLRPVLVALAIASAITQMPGVLVDYAKVSVAYARAGGGNARATRLYTWEESGLVLNTRAAVTMVPENVRHLVRQDRPVVGADASAGRDESDLSQRLAFSLDFWWLYLYYLGAVPAVVSVTLGALPLAGAVLIARRLARLVRAAAATPA